MPCALVLSAGGMFGAYQAGAWNVLSQRFQPDLVVGTSAGALNGWAIAGGCPAAELTALWRSPVTATTIRLRFPLIPWEGCIDPAGLTRQVEDWYVRFKPRIPFALTMVEVPRLRLVRVANQEITPRHLMASCAIPAGYPPVRIKGKLYVDGGVLDVLPIWAAVELGATRVVAVNVLPLMPSRPLRAALSVLRFLGQKRAAGAGVDVLQISPRVPLGSIRDALTWNSSSVNRWIRQGEEDAAAACGGQLCAEAINPSNS
jgi:predicted acylesterase/phospholipase RssA